MAARGEPAETQDLLRRMVEAITAAQTQTPWPAQELAALADEVIADESVGDDGPTRVWTLS